MWHGKSPSLSFIRIWGCDAFVKCVTSDKLGPKSNKCKFVGYPKTTMGYQFYHPSENKVFVARTTVFLEREFISKGNSGRVIDLDEIQEPQIVSQPEEEPEHVLQRVAVQDEAQIEQGGQMVAPPVVAQPGQGVQRVTAPQTDQDTREPRRSGRARHKPERYYGFS